MRPTLITFYDFLSQPETDKWIILAVLLFVIVSLFRNWVKPSLLFFISVITLMVLGVTEPASVLEGLSNKSVITILLLIIITASINEHFNLEALLDKTIGSIKNARVFMFRMTASVAILSSFLNNTPVVALMTPYVYNWSKEHGVHPSKLLIPLSYSTILGGMITPIGTSTNLVLIGLMQAHGLDTLHFTDFLFLGITVTCVGITYLCTYGYKLLPKKQEAFTDVRNIAPEYLVETEVVENAPFIGKTLAESGLMDYQNMYLIEIHRNNETISPIPPDLALEPLDRLIYMGQTEKIMSVIHSEIGLRMPNHDEDLSIVEAIVSANSILIDQTAEEVNLKLNFDAELLAIQREGEKFNKGLEKRRFKSGDLLLLSVEDNFFKNSQSLKAFYVLSHLTKPQSKLGRVTNKFLWMSAIIIGGLLFGFWDIFTTTLLILTSLLVLKLTSFRNLSSEIDLDLVVLLVSALALSKAFIDTGAAQMVSALYIQLFYPLGQIGILSGLFLLTVIITSFVTNVAAVSITFPIAYSASIELGVDGTPFFLAIAFGASAAFLTPVSYQTNWMVYAPGGYTPKDFLKTGLPLTIIYTIICLSYIILRYNL
ncbi:SLC13 family permease [Limibacter armeniacum]|uniref:SLC13 family permease n=1 Tax=Limibacter armeniacum TaxID=466084 RepID=UPI002FE678E5